MSRECIGCHKEFPLLYNVPNQQYCVKGKCQLERRARWQKRKLAEDADYREHQKKAKKKWCEKHPEYMREYRKKNTEYRERDNQQRRERRKRAMLPQTAEVKVTAPKVCAVKMDECKNGVTSIKSGIFRLIRVPEPKDCAVNMDECGSCGYDVVQLIVLDNVTVNSTSSEAAP